MTASTAKPAATATTATAPAVTTTRTAAELVAVIAGALAVNLAILGVASAAGAGFTFHQDGDELAVGAFAVSLMTVGPLVTGLAVTALVGLWWPAVTRVALVVAPALALVTIAGMTLPADFDTASTVALSLMHLVLVPTSVVAVLVLRKRLTARRR